MEGKAGHHRNGQCPAIGLHPLGDEMQPKAGRVAGGVGGLQPAPAPLWCALLGDLATPAVRISLGEGHPRPAIQQKWCLPCCSKRGAGAFSREHFVMISDMGPKLFDGRGSSDSWFGSVMRCLLGIGSYSLR